MGDSEVHPVPEADFDAEYRRWLSRMVLQIIVLNGALPPGHATNSVQLMLLTVAKAALDGQELTVADIVAYARARGAVETSLRYLDLLERNGWVCRNPAQPDHCRPTEEGDALVRMMWQRSRNLYDRAL